MRVRNPKTNSPPAVLFDDAAARRWVIDQIGYERYRSHVATPLARRALARRLGVAPGTVENIERGRFKGMRANLRDAIHKHKIEFFEKQIEAARHELEIARSGSCPSAPASVRALEAAIEAAVARLKELRDA